MMRGLAFDATNEVTQERKIIIKANTFSILRHKCISFPYPELKSNVCVRQHQNCRSLKFRRKKATNHELTTCHEMLSDTDALETLTFCCVLPLATASAYQ